MTTTRPARLGSLWSDPETGRRWVALDHPRFVCSETGFIMDDDTTRARAIADRLVPTDGRRIVTRCRTTAAVPYLPAALLIAAHIAVMAYIRHLENR